MLDLHEKQKVKELLQEVLRDLNVNPSINIAYFLNAIDESNKDIKALKSSVQRMMQQQAVIEQKLDLILRRIGWNISRICKYSVKGIIKMLN